MTTPHARHLAEMRSTLPPRPVDAIPAIVSHLRDLVPCATRRHLLEMRVLAVLADGEWHRHEEVEGDRFVRRARVLLHALECDGVVIRGPLGWRLAPGERCVNCGTAFSCTGSHADGPPWIVGTMTDRVLVTVGGVGVRLGDLDAPEFFL